MYTGPHIKKDGLVFGYDSGYGIAGNNTATRFYPGEPTTNLVPSGQSNGTSALQRQGYHVQVFTYSQITNYKGRPHVHRLYINPTTSSPYADFGGQYHKSGGSVVGDVYTISFDYNIAKGTGTPGMSVIYANGYKSPTSSGAASLSSATVTNLENGWKRKTQTATITIAGNSWFRLGLSSNNVETEVYIDNFQVELKPHASPFTDGTRSSTQSLIDLTKTRNIDVSNVSFDSNGLPTFDGTDDEINTGITTQLVDFSCVVVFKNNSSASWGRLVDKQYTTGFFISSYFYSGGSGYVGAGIIEPSYPHGQSLPYDISKYNYFVVTRSGTTHTIYLNGSTNSLSKTGSGATLSSNEMAIGAWNGSTSSQRHTGEIPVVKLYNRALTPKEIQQDFRAYKNRFNI